MATLPRNCILPIYHWYYGFEFHLQHKCMSPLFCEDRGLAMGQSMYKESQQMSKIRRNQYYLFGAVDKTVVYL